MNYFSKEINKIRLKKSCEKWENTPYLHMGTTLGGIDCANLIGNILIECGVIGAIEKQEYYPKDWHIHSSKELIISSINKHKKYSIDCELINFQYSSNYSPEIGDIIAMSTDRAKENHLAIVSGNKTIFHCIHKLGCKYSQYNEFWRGITTNVYRIVGGEGWE